MTDPAPRLGEIKANAREGVTTTQAVQQHADWAFDVRHQGEQAVSAAVRLLVEAAPQLALDRDWLLEHIEQLQRQSAEWSNEIASLLPERYDGEASQEGLILDAVRDLVALSETPESQRLREAESAAETYGISMRGMAEELNLLRAQRHAVLDLCDKAVTQPRGRGGLELMAPVGAIRKALGADDGQ